MKLFNRQRVSLVPPKHELNLYNYATAINQKSFNGSKKSLLGSGTTDYTSTNISNKVVQIASGNTKQRDFSLRN